MQHRVGLVILTVLSLAAGLVGGTPVLAAPPAQSPTQPAANPATGGLWRRPAVSAEAAVVIDDTTGELIYGKNAHKRLAPASLTKVVTAVVALERGSLHARVPIDVHWSELKDSTRMGLIPGESLTLEELLYGLMLPSGNDAAVAIARYIGGSEEGFARLMNQKAAELGLTDSHFVNSHGLDADGHYTSAYDITQFSRYAMRNAAFVRIAATKDLVVRGTLQTYDLGSLIRRWLDGYRGADGVKTGLTDNAGLTIVASATREGRRAFVGALRSGAHLTDAQVLMDYYFNGRAWLGSDEAMTLSGSRFARSLMRDVPTGPLTAFVRLPAQWQTAIDGTPLRAADGMPPAGQYDTRLTSAGGG